MQSAETVDLFVLDVEGHEIAVIEGMSGAKVLPKVMCVEHGQVGLDVLNDKLSTLGFEFASSLHVNSFFVRKQ